MLLTFYFFFFKANQISEINGNKCRNISSVESGYYSQRLSTLTTGFACLEFSGLQNGDKQPADTTTLDCPCCKRMYTHTHTQTQVSPSVASHWVPSVWLQGPTLIGLFPFVLLHLNKILRSRLDFLNPGRPASTNTQHDEGQKAQQSRARTHRHAPWSGDSLSVCPSAHERKSSCVDINREERSSSISMAMNRHTCWDSAARYRSLMLSVRSM